MHMQDVYEFYDATASEVTNEVIEMLVDFLEDKKWFEWNYYELDDDVVVNHMLINLVDKTYTCNTSDRSSPIGIGWKEFASVFDFQSYISHILNLSTTGTSLSSLPSQNMSTPTSVLKTKVANNYFEKKVNIDKVSAFFDDVTTIISNLTELSKASLNIAQKVQKLLSEADAAFSRSDIKAYQQATDNLNMLLEYASKNTPFKDIISTATTVEAKTEKFDPAAYLA